MPVGKNYLKLAQTKSAIATLYLEPAPAQWLERNLGGVQEKSISVSGTRSTRSHGGRLFLPHVTQSWKANGKPDITVAIEYTALMDSNTLISMVAEGTD